MRCLFLLHRTRRGPGRTTRAGTIHFRVLPLGSSTRSSDLSLLFPVVTNRYSHRMRALGRSSSFCSAVSSGSHSALWAGRSDPLVAPLLCSLKIGQLVHLRPKPIIIVTVLFLGTLDVDNQHVNKDNRLETHMRAQHSQERARKEETTFTFPLAVTTFPLGHQVVHHRQLLLPPPSFVLHQARPA